VAALHQHVLAGNPIFRERKFDPDKFDHQRLDNFTNAPADPSGGLHLEIYVLLDLHFRLSADLIGHWLYPRVNFC
jgi:hypothetical protein